MLTSSKRGPGSSATTARKDAPQSDAAQSARPGSGLYRLVWRWHFLAGLVCLPVLVTMAITGALYLFREAISDAVYPSRFLPQASLDRAALPLGTVVEHVLAAHPGVLHEIALPADARRSVALEITLQGGERSVLHVDRTDARVLGIREKAWLWDEIAKGVHSGKIFGRWASIAVEIVAGWCIVLILSGTYLWWPRGREGGVLSVRGSPRGRLWWRDLHAVAGATAGAVILFLAVTGMPWTELWGPQFSALSQRFRLGHPMHVWDAVPQSTVPMRAQGEVPWTFSNATVPASDSAHHGHDQRAHDGQQASTRWGLVPPAIGIDRAVHAFADIGLAGGYTLRLPFGADGAYTALRFPQHVADQRVAHLDQYSGRVLIDVRFQDYGAIAKGVEWSIGVHMGREYGGINQAVMLAGCLSVLLLVVTAVTMWWKRRPQGRLAAPPRKEGERLARGAVAIAAVLGLLFPTLGASMLAAAALEWLWVRRAAA